MSDFKSNFINKQPRRLADSPWLNFEEPEVILIQGQRGSGKSVTSEFIAEQLYKKGLLILHIWGARSFENIYWAINKNCQTPYTNLKKFVDCFYKNSDENLRVRFGQEFEKYRELAIKEGLIAKLDNKLQLLSKGKQLHFNQLLHCKCHKSYPIIWVVPDYIEFDQESLDKFNGLYWKDVGEYSKENSEITSADKKKLEEGKLLRPGFLQPKTKIIVRKITPPTTPNRKEIFREEFTKIVLEARKEHRIITMNPAIFEGVVDKFETLAEIFRMIPWLMNNSGHFVPKENPQNKWESSWHKIAIIINELRSVVPSSNIHGEKNASTSKKAIFDYIPEARHYKTWFVGDYQNPQDLYPGVRYQSNLVIIKRASKNILGDDWSWMFEKIKEDRLNFFNRRFGKDLKKEGQLSYYERIPLIRDYLDSRRTKIGELPSNRGYVTYPNNELKLETLDMPSFHHKGSMDDFFKDTGITWKTNHDKKPKEERRTDRQTTKKKKVVKEEILKKIDYMRSNEKKSFEQIKIELVSMEKEGIIQDMGFSIKTPVYFNNWYLEWKKRKRLEDTNESSE